MKPGDLIMDRWNYDRLLGLVVNQRSMNGKDSRKRVRKLKILWTNGELEELDYLYCKKYMRVLMTS